MAWVCKDCGYAVDEDKSGDNRCPQCGETMENDPNTDASAPDFFGDKKDQENKVSDLDHPKDPLDS